MGTSRIKKPDKGFGKRNTRKTVAERKKIRRMMVCKMVKELKASGKPIDLQAINKEVLDICRRRHQGRKPQA
jgi:hypothetical protein